MTEVVSLIWFFLAIFVSYAILHFLDLKFGKLVRPVLNQISDVNRDVEIQRLQKQLDEQKELFISQLNSQAQVFEQRLEEQRLVFENKIKALEQHNQFLLERLVAREKASKVDEYTDNEKMLFISADETFYSRDRTALFRADLKFTTLRKATSQTINRELRQAREQGRPYHLVLVSAHGNEQGILLADGLKSSEWFSQNFFSVEIAVFAACKSFNILNDLTGIVSYSIGMMDDIETDLAEDFIYIFWREYLLTKNAIVAFNNAKKIMPELSDRVTIRYTG